MRRLVFLLLALLLSSPVHATAYSTVTTKLGHTARVISSAREQFQSFINEVEKTYTIKYIGCLSTGHMKNSKHHWGGACDIMQSARNKTAAFMYHVTRIAHEHGLIDGCQWHHPDCGHIEVPGRNSPVLNAYAQSKPVQLSARGHHERVHHRSERNGKRRVVHLAHNQSRYHSAGDDGGYNPTRYY